MTNGSKQGNGSRWQRRALVWRFVLAGATQGLLVGLYEAALLYSTPRIPTLLQTDVHWVIWFLAPLVALSFFALLGGALGCFAAAGKRPTPWRIVVLAAAGLGVAGFYLALAVALSQVWVSDRLSSRYLPLPSLCFVAVFVSALLIFRVWQRRGGSFFDIGASGKLGPLAKFLVVTALVCISGIALHAVHTSTTRVSAASPSRQTRGGPNIVLIVLDTVRADHLSSYGYPLPITPNLDRLASRGVLFENAVAPSSWTLPSVGSMFTGLLPHQHGANWAVPLDTAPKTLAEILESRGYETVGFNGNPAYGLAGWGIGQGFGLYYDDSFTVRHNLAATLVGRTLIQPLCDRLIHYDSFDRRNACEVNRDVFSWLRRRSTRPFFLFVNYFDAHYPYFPPPPYDRRFGKISEALIRHAGNFEYRGHVPKPPAGEQAALITAYDNCLAYLDDQVGKLLQVLSSSPEWPNTVVIITADHGESFGEHASYGHGVDLYREVLHVPLILFGPGIPVGRRITNLASTRELFPTLLELAMGPREPFGGSSLRRLWTLDSQTQADDDQALAELITGISLTTSEWHFIYYADGRSELFHWRSDPQEQVNLSDTARYRRTREALLARLDDRVRLSFEPWRGPEYLLALKQSGQPPTIEAGRREKPHSPFPGAEGRVGASQAVFAPDAGLNRPRPLPTDPDLLNSLPYH